MSLYYPLGVLLPLISFFCALLDLYTQKESLLRKFYYFFSECFSYDPKFLLIYCIYSPFVMSSSLGFWLIYIHKKRFSLRKKLLVCNFWKLKMILFASSSFFFSWRILKNLFLINISDPSYETYWILIF